MSKALCVLALLVLFTGCIGKNTPSTEQAVDGEIIGIVVANKTLDIDPADKVLIPSDISDLKYCDVVTSEYKNLDIMLEEGISKNEYDSLKASGYIEGYEVEYEVKRESNGRESRDAIKNTISKYEAKGTLFRRMDDLEEIYKSNNMEVLTGREFGDRAMYIRVGRGHKAHVQVENIEIYFEIFREEGEEGKLSDLYPYIWLLITRLTSDEEVQPPVATAQ